MDYLSSGKPPRMLGTTTQTPIVVMRIAGADLPDPVQYNCTYTIVTADLPGGNGGKYIYKPEQENFILNLNMYDNPAGELGKDVNDKIDDAEKKHWYFGSWLDELNKLFSMGQRICGLLNSFTTLTDTFNLFTGGVEAAAKLDPSGVIKGPATVVSQANVGLNNLHDGLFSWIDPVCGIISCSKDSFPRKYAEKTPGWKYLVTAVTWNPVSKKKMPFDPKKSFISSIITFCVPGFITNVYKFKDVNCRYTYCLKYEIPAGKQTLATCDEMHNYDKCVLWDKQVINSFAVTQAINSLWDAVGNSLKDPISSLGLISSAVCGFNIISRTSFICTTPKLIAKWIELAKSITSFTGPGGPTALPTSWCDALKKADEASGEQNE